MHGKKEKNIELKLRRKKKKGNNLFSVVVNYQKM